MCQPPNDQLQRTVKEKCQVAWISAPPLRCGVMRRSMFIALLIGAACQSTLSAAGLPECPANTRAKYEEMLTIEPPTPGYKLSGSVVVTLTILPSGDVADVSLEDIHLTPSDTFFPDYVRRSAALWRFFPREKACRWKHRYSFDISTRA